MQKLALHVAAISLLCAGSAIAADMRMPVKAPPPAPAPVAYNWTGCYIGGGGGYGLFDQESQAFDATGAAIGVKNDNGGRGWLATVQVGCDLQVASNFVIGAFADFDWSDIRGDMSIASEALVGREKLKNSWAAGGRIGYVPFDRLLVYVSGGFTQARFGQVDLNSAVTGAPTGLSLEKHKYNGWFVGTGYEYGFNWLPIPGLFWKTEYRFADYGKDHVSVFDALGPTGATVESRKFVHTVRSELVWRFNWGGGAPVAARY